MKIFVITGGPGTGKTSVISELSKEFKILPEAARYLGDNDIRFKGKSVNEITITNFEDAIFEFQKKQIKELGNSDEIVFADRGIIDNIAYRRSNGLNINEREIKYMKIFRYSGVFVFDLLKSYVKDGLRQENKEKQIKIHNEIIKTYNEFGYKVIKVPFMTIEKRTKFIKDYLKTHGQ